MNNEHSIRTLEHSIAGNGHSSGTDGHSSGMDEHSSGTDEHSMGTDEHSMGTDGHSRGTDGHSRGTDGHSRGTDGHNIYDIPIIIGDEKYFAPMFRPDILDKTLKRTKFQGFILWIILLFSPFLTFSQQYNFTSYSVAEGLPQTTIYTILQDSRGYIWVGTDGGLSKFDGNSFKTFTKKEGLVGNVVRSIMEDHKGNLWLGTNEGISVYNGIKFRTINNKNGLSGSTVLKIFEDSKNTVWAGTDDGGLNRIKNEGKDTSIKVYNSNTAGFKGDFIFDMYEDKSHRLWLAMFYQGIAVMNFTKDTFQVDYLRLGKIPSELILTIKEDKDKNLWFGTYDAGAFEIIMSGRDSGKVIPYTTSNGLHDNTVMSIQVARDGAVWFGTKSGICTSATLSDRSLSGAETNTHHKFQYYTEQTGLPSNQILTIYEDKESNIWLGTSGSGLCRFQGEHFVHYTKKDGLPNNQILAVTQDNDGNYWLGTKGGGVTKLSCKDAIHGVSAKTYTTKDGLADNIVNAIAKAKDGSIWIATTAGASHFDGKKFRNFTGDDSLIHSTVNTVLVDDKGYVWLGTSAGISKFDGKAFIHVKRENNHGINEKFATIYIGAALGSDEIQTIIEDRKKNFWFGTSAGLTKYSDEKFTSYDEVEGLMSKNVSSLAEDDLGNIWIGTTEGIYKLDANTKNKKCIQFIADDSLLSSNAIVSIRFQNQNTLLVGTNKGFDKVLLNKEQQIISVRKYSKSDGFVGVECNPNALYLDNQKNLWFGTVNGLTSYRPSLENNQKVVPRVYITGIQLFYKDIDWKNKADSITPWFNLPKMLNLSYSDNNLTFKFGAISYSNPEKVFYKYRLTGQGDEWSPLTKETQRTYSGLNPGEYTFEVIAINEQGVSSEPTKLTYVIINPPWYKTIWAYISYIVLLLTSFFLYVKIRERKLKQEKKVLEEKVIERTKEVVQQKEIIEEKNKDIMSSIRYAKRIQDAILPPDKLVKQHLQNSFILFKPKDIVSGDFYFMEYVEGKILFAVCDCTGHGVPGAFVSIVGHNSLSRAIKEFKLREPAKILDKLNELVEETFRQQEKTDIRDGMDIALCSLEFGVQSSEKLPTLHYSGANNSMYLIRKKGADILDGYKAAQESDTHTLYEIKADKQPIGAYDDRKNFTEHVFELQQGDAVYVFSDGYADQFGGPKGKKFKYSQFEKLLLDNQDKPIHEHKEILNNAIEQWKGDLEQVDDICVIGVKVSNYS